MIITLAWAALRRHPFSVACTALLAVASASLLGAPAPLAVVLWATTSMLGLTVWYALEPVILRRLGCRSPNRLERLQLDSALRGIQVDVVMLDVAEPWLGRGLRSVVVSRAMFDLLTDRAILGVLAQAVEEVRLATLAGDLVVWLGNLPLVSAWVFGIWLTRMGRLLAIVVGNSLVVPMLLWPAGFTRWGGRLCGSLLVGLVGSALLSSGLAAPGLGLLLGWALVPGVRALVAWEWRRAEQVVDQTIVEAGLGWQLLEAFETLAFAESVPPPDGLLGLLCRRGSPLSARADRIWRTLTKTS